MISSGVRLMLTVLIASLIIIGFTILFGWGILATWQSNENTAITFTENYLYAATALAGLIGGLVAASFNQSLTPPPDTNEIHIPFISRLLAILGGIVLPKTPEEWQRAIASIYAIVYVLLSTAAIVTWIAKSTMTPDLVKNLASISFGLFLAIARSFLSKSD